MGGYLPRNVPQHQLFRACVLAQLLQPVQDIGRDGGLDNQLLDFFLDNCFFNNLFDGWQWFAEQGGVHGREHRIRLQRLAKIAKNLKIQRLYPPQLLGKARN